MSSIIGIIGSDAKADPVVIRLRQAGIPEERIKIVTNPRMVNQLLGHNPSTVIKHYAALGAAIGLGIYAIFGIFAAMCQCNLMQFGQAYGVGALLGALLAGVFVGGGIGVLVGAGVAEENTHAYVRGVMSGNRLISIQVAEEDAERVKHILAEEHAQEVQVLQQKGA